MNGVTNDSIAQSVLDMKGQGPRVVEASFLLDDVENAGAQLPANETEAGDDEVGDICPICSHVVCWGDMVRKDNGDTCHAGCLDVVPCRGCGRATDGSGECATCFPPTDDSLCVRCGKAEDFCTCERDDFDAEREERGAIDDGGHRSFE